MHGLYRSGRQWCSARFHTRCCADVLFQWWICDSSYFRTWFFSRVLSAVSLLSRKAVLCLSRVQARSPVLNTNARHPVGNVCECGILLSRWTPSSSTSCMSETRTVLWNVIRATFDHFTKKSRMRTFNFAFRDPFLSCHFWSMIVLHVWTAKCIHVVLLPWRTAEINFTVMEEQHQHWCHYWGGGSVHYQPWDHLHLLVSVCEGQTGRPVQYEPKQEKEGDKQTRPITSFTGTTVAQRHPAVL